MCLIKKTKLSALSPFSSEIALSNSLELSPALFKDSLRTLDIFLIELLSMTSLANKGLTKKKQVRVIIDLKLIGA